MTCAQTLDRVLKNLLESFSNETDYLQILVQVRATSCGPLWQTTGRSYQCCLLGQAFRDSMTKVMKVEDGGDGSEDSKRKKKQRARSPLENFALIVPPMTISYVDAIKAAKDRLDKVRADPPISCSVGPMNDGV